MKMIVVVVFPAVVVLLVAAAVAATTITLPLLLFQKVKLVSLAQHHCPVTFEL
jgi:hypothetical protein